MHRLRPPTAVVVVMRALGLVAAATRRPLAVLPARLPVGSLPGLASVVAEEDSTLHKKVQSKPTKELRFSSERNDCKRNEA